MYKRNQSFALLLQSIERVKGKVPGEFLGNKTKGEELHFFTFLVLKKRSPRKSKMNRNAFERIINDWN